MSYSVLEIERVYLPLCKVEDALLTPFVGTPLCFYNDVSKMWCKKIADFYDCLHKKYKYICITFVQCWTNVEHIVRQMLYKCFVFAWKALYEHLKRCSEVFKE